MAHCGLPTGFWGDAVLYVIYIRNRCLTTVDKIKTPYELWTGKRPNVSHIRVFGSDCYMHIKRTDRKKIQPKAFPCILLGFSEYNYGYKLYSIGNHKVYYSRDVTFKENEFNHVALIKQTGLIKKIGDPITDIPIPLTNQFEALLDESVIMESPGLIDGLEKQNQVNREEIKERGDEGDDEKYASDEDGDTSQEEQSDSSEGREEASDNNASENVEQSENESEAEIIQSDSEIVSEHRPPVRQPRFLRLLTEDRQHRMFFDPTRPRRNTQANITSMVADTEKLSASVVDESYLGYCFMTSIHQEPTSYTEAMNSKNAKEWKRAITKEYDSLILNGTWEKCPLPDDRTKIGCKWVFKHKINKDGEIERYKARLVAKGYSQKEGIDYTETFAPVLKYKSLRILLAIAAIQDMEVKQMDVETAFLNAEIKEEVYMEQPEGYHDGSPNNVYRLLKTIYGTKQAPYEWNNTLNDFIVNKLKFNRCQSDTCTYMTKSKKGNPMIIAVFVDDIIILYMKQDEEEWCGYKKQFMDKFKMKDLNDAEWILGIRITRDRNTRTIKLDHEIQINKSLETFRMSQCNPAPTPTEVRKLTMEDCPVTQEEKNEMAKVPYKSLIGSLQYIALSTRPDIAYAVNQLSRYLANPGPAHWQAGKRVLRYLKGTASECLLYKDYSGDKNTKIEVFCDADWAGDHDDRKSTTGIIIKLNGCPIVWLSKKQSIVALSTAEAEYIAISTALQELLWINQYLTEIEQKDTEVAVMKSDNQAAIQLATNDTYHSRSKHIDIRHHFIREIVRRGEVELRYVGTREQEADLNTKGLDANTFKRLRDRIVSRQPREFN